MGPRALIWAHRTHRVLDYSTRPYCAVCTPIFPCLLTLASTIVPAPLLFKLEPLPVVNGLRDSYIVA
jgi:hypothetical protein